MTIGTASLGSFSVPLQQGQGVSFPGPSTPLKRGHVAHQVFGGVARHFREIVGFKSIAGRLTSKHYNGIAGRQLGINPGRRASIGYAGYVTGSTQPAVSKACRLGLAVRSTDRRSSCHLRGEAAAARVRRRRQSPGSTTPVAAPHARGSWPGQFVREELAVPTGAIWVCTATRRDRFDAVRPQLSMQQRSELPAAPRASRQQQIWASDDAGR